MNESSAYTRKGISHKVEGLGASIHGGRPNFALKKGEKTYTVYELLPQEQAEAFKERWKNNRKIKRQVKIVDADFIEDEEWEWDEWKAAKIASLDQAKFDSCRSLLKKLLAESENSYNDLLKTTDTIILLPESIGVQVALAFRGIKPLKRVDKQREFIRQLEKMDVEECYYWHSLCRSPSTPNGAKALRVLLTDHIE